MTRMSLIKNHNTIEPPACTHAEDTKCHEEKLFCHRHSQTMTGYYLPVLWTKHLNRRLRR